jgi:hypothetical protein
METEIQRVSTNETILRVPSSTDVCGHTIGKVGQNIKKMEEEFFLGILGVKWDNASQTIIL